MKNLRRIAIVGVEGAGKTVMLASLGGYYTQSTDEPVFLVNEDGATHAYVQEQIDRMTRHLWPAATERKDVQGLKWLLEERRGAAEPAALCELSCLDFGGEVYRAAYGTAALHAEGDLGDEAERLRRYVRAADGVVVLINLSDVVQSHVTPAVLESMRISEAILGDVLNRPGRGRRKKVQVAIALSLSDAYADTIRKEGGPVGVLRRYLPQVANQFAHLGVFCTHSVDVDLDDDGRACPAGFSAEGLRPLMNWIVACARGRDLTLDGDAAAGGPDLTAGDRPGAVRTVALSGSVGIDLVYCAPGRFVMGSPEGEDGRTCDDETQHAVVLTQGFWIGKYPVTQEQWACLMLSNPSFAKGERRPVESVSWDDCTAFLAALNDRKGGAGFRLPTEAEWEYACRAGSDGPFGEGRADDVAWYRENAVASVPSDGGTRDELATHPVGQKAANGLGLHDMHGNVWEWCGDFYGEYPDGEATDPTGPVEGAERVVRGGAFNNAASFCRAAYRQRHAPGYRMRNLGFRVCAAARPNGA